MGIRGWGFREREREIEVSSLERKTYFGGEGYREREREVLGFMGVERERVEVRSLDRERGRDRNTNIGRVYKEREKEVY